MTADRAPGENGARRALPEDDHGELAAPSRPSDARRAEHRGFGASLGYSLLGTILPGAGLFRARRPFLGAAVLGGFVLTVAAGLAGWFFARDLLLSLAVNPTALIVIAVGLLVVALAWITSVIVTHLSLRPKPAKAWHRVVGALAVAVLSFAIAAPMAFAAKRAYDQYSFVSDVFGSDDQAPGTVGAGGQTKQPMGNLVDPWANKPRLNVLILGGDSGKGRSEELGARADTVILASINTRTGDTILYQLPRQTQRMPFPKSSPLSKKYPNGFTNGVANNSEFFLNSMYDNVPRDAGPDILGRRYDNLGAEVMKISVGEALGLEVDYYVMVDMDGFVQFIDAIGGITVNINEPVPVGGQKEPTKGIDIPPDEWLPPGPNQHLNGRNALWYARGRYGVDDYARGIRQRCVINAVAKQANPTTILANYEKITDAGRKIIRTDVPSKVLGPMVTLAMRVKDSKMRSYAFINDKDGFSTVVPDWDLVRERVRGTLDPPARTPKPSTSASSTPKPSASPSGSASPNPDATVDDICGYHPADPKAKPTTQR